MEYKIIKKDTFNLIGLKKQVTVNHSGVNEEIKAMNEHLTTEIRSEIASLSTIEPKGLVNASMNFIDRHLDGVGKFDRIIGAATTASISDKYEVSNVPALTWAVFTCSGIFPKALHSAYQEINSDFFVNSEYTKDLDMEMVIHIMPAIPGKEYKGEIWLPVKLKEDK
ncbi:GyrI-like domain-containing protein [Mollicutes bacterium LVI A0078]|nr:GyrI-like domain-containing protein [Mollicutes bacterium LVI A0075]WOO90738.1 GyrI-like domain-containing protein [Mollicutes bacterium LVI A0078]